MEECDFDATWKYLEYNGQVKFVKIAGNKERFAQCATQIAAKVYQIIRNVRCSSASRPPFLLPDIYDGLNNSICR